ncbi:MAG: dynamin family protein [Phycisphaerae bacterium]
MSSLPKNDVQKLLDQSIEQLNLLQNGFSEEIKSLGELKKRLLEGRFHLAVLGQFKRGKSTFLNALLGEDILPSSVIPLTAIPTFIRAGEPVSAKVFFDDERPIAEYAGAAGQVKQFISQYVAEGNNPANQLNVREVEVFHPSRILYSGVVMIDTPGIGSTYKHNTEATLNFLPQCDAALFLVSADPPITDVEIEFLKKVRKKVPRLFFILNKIDYLTVQEKEEILSFVRSTLIEKVGIEEDVRIFGVSARLGLQAREANDKDLWEKSGLISIESYLINFLANEKTEALQQAVRKKAVDIIGESLMQIQISVKSLQMPLDDLEKRLNVFTEKLTELQQSKLSEMDILEGDKKRMHEFLEEYAEKLRQKSKTYLKGVVKEVFLHLEPEQLKEDVIEQSLAEVIPAFFEHQMGLSTEIFQEKMQQVLGPHRLKLNRLVEAIRQTAAELFDIPYQQVRSAEDFEIVKRPYWVSHQWARSFQRIARSFLDNLLPSGLRKSQLNKRAAEQIDELVMQNVENLRWAVYQNIDKSFIRFDSELQKRFDQTLIATQGAIQAALKKRKEHSETIAADIIEFEKSLANLTNIQESLIHSSEE